MQKPKDMICLDCQSIGKITRQAEGYLIIEILLWLCFLLPGLIYSIWRMSNKYWSCKVCGGRRIVPIDSPVTKTLLKNQN